MHQEGCAANLRRASWPGKIRFFSGEGVKRSDSLMSVGKLDNLETSNNGETKGGEI